MPGHSIGSGPSIVPSRLRVRPCASRHGVSFSCQMSVPSGRVYVSTNTEAASAILSKTWRWSTAHRGGAFVWSPATSMDGIG